MKKKYKVPTEYLAALTKERNDEIARVMKQGANRLQAAIAYDFSKSPVTTNRIMLGLCGIEISNEDLVTDEQAEEIIHTCRTCLLEVWHINFTRTDHFSPRELYRKFVEMMDEQVRMLVPNDEAWEIVQVDNDEVIFWQHYATEDERRMFAKTKGREPIPYQAPKWERDHEFHKRYEAMKPDLNNLVEHKFPVIPPHINVHFVHD